MKTYPWFTRGDLDGFFGLFIDNLLQLMLIVTLCTYVVDLPTELTHGTILPAAALSILGGNLFYAWQARRLAISRHRPYTTALPYGINTVSLFAFVFFVMVPVYKETGSPKLAWQAGLFACLGSGVIEMAGAFFWWVAAPSHAARRLAHRLGRHRSHIYIHGFCFSDICQSSGRTHSRLFNSHQLRIESKTALAASGWTHGIALRDRHCLGIPCHGLFIVPPGSHSFCHRNAFPCAPV